MTRPGNLQVIAAVTALDNASLEVRVGKPRARAQVPATGDYGRFKIVRFGTLDPPAGNSVTLSLHAVKDGWQPVNVRSIKLQPVK